MTRGLLPVAIVVAAALLAIAASFQAAREAPAEFRFVNGTEPESLDPHLVTGQPEGRLAWALFEGLTRYDERTISPLPGTASHWEISPDGRRYVFHIREDARWSDGRAVTAHDFAYSWRRLQTPSLASEYAYLLHGVRFAEEFNLWAGQAERLDGDVREALATLRDGTQRGVDAELWAAFLRDQGVADLCRGTTDAELAEWLARAGSGIEKPELARFDAALQREAARKRAGAAEASRRFGIDAGIFAQDDKTLVVELEAPLPYFLSLIAFYPAVPVPKWVVEAPGNEGKWFLAETMVSNGPYRLASWRVNDRIRLVPNEFYWGHDEVQLASIDALPVENEMTALNLYLTGEVDWSPRYPSDLAPALQGRSDFYTEPGLIVYYYMLNNERPPFDDPRVRKAVNLAVDRREVTDGVLRLGQVPAHHIVPPGLAGYEPPESTIRFDPEAARALLAEAGYPGGEGLDEIGILYNTLEMHKSIAELIADQLRRNLGLDVRAYNQEWQSYLSTRRARNYDIARAGWIGDYLDPNTFLDLWTTSSGNNQTGFSNDTYDRLVAAAADVDAFAMGPERNALAVKQRARLDALLAEFDAAPNPASRRQVALRLRMQLLREAEAVIVQDEFPILPIYFYVNSGLVRPWVKGFHMRTPAEGGKDVVNLQDIHPLRAIGIDAAARAAGRER